MLNDTLFSQQADRVCISKGHVPDRISGNGKPDAAAMNEPGNTTAKKRLTAKQTFVYNPPYMEQRIKICPECNAEIRYGTFVSCKDNKTRICGVCAVIEAAQELDSWQQAGQQRSRF